MGKYIGVVGSLASILAILFSDLSQDAFWKWFLPFLALIGLLWSCFYEVYAYIKQRPKKFNRRENIEYMNRIIRNEGRVVVFAGNLSWVDNDEMKKTMIGKGGDLYLCVKHTASYLDDFRAAGVHVYTYGSGSFSPTTRFTVLRQGSTNERVAITAILDTDDKETRLVYEISKDDKNFKDSWIVYAAEDLFNLLKILNGEG